MDGGNGGINGWQLKDMVSFGDNENIVKLIVVMVACVCKDTKKTIEL